MDHRKPHLTIITPCARPDNLATLSHAFREAREQFYLKWVIVHDCRAGQCNFPHPPISRVMHQASRGYDTAGHVQVNAALDTISDESWVWRLDDDNLPVDGFFRRLGELDRKNGINVDLYLFGQIARGRYDESEWPGGLVPPVPRVGKMDSAQFVFRREALGDLRFLRDDYKADGYLVEALVERVRLKTYSVIEPLTQYNALARPTINQASGMFPALSMPGAALKGPATRFSIITPTYGDNERFLAEAYASLKAQTEQDWEWIVMTSGGAGPATGDERVRTLWYAGSRNVGSLKLALCGESRGRFIVELDHDDVLAPTALERVGDALKDADFAYSDFAEFNDHDGSAGEPYRADCGWEIYPVPFRGKTILAHRAPPATPQNVRMVDWAPNHVRAWTKAAYLEVGGHDKDLMVGDDHDLVCRFMLAGKRFVHIDECLYFYRLHPRNGVKLLNAEIRAQAHRNYERYCWGLAEMSGKIHIARDTSRKNEMKPGEWLFLLCPRASWDDRRVIPKFKGVFHIAKLYDRGYEMEAHLIRLGDGYEPMGELCGD